MHRTLGLSIAGLALLLSACDDQPLPHEVTDDVAFSAAAVGPRTLRMLDVCEPESFNAAIGAGTCINRRGGVSFDLFISLLTKHQTVESWRFMPKAITVRAGTTLPLLNQGGEVHTFTEVAEFAGGVVPVLNALTGETSIAPECLGGAEFVPAGGSTEQTFASPGEKKFMCCIHPWMRAVAHVH